MKKVWKKLNSKELLSEFIAHGIVIFLGCNFILLHILMIISKSVISASDVRIAAFSIIAVFIIVLMSAISLYKTSSSYIQWHREIFNSIPLPVIITDERANWQQINKAACCLLRQEFDFDANGLSSKHLIDENGDIMKKLATQQGVEYQIIGSHLYDGGKETGYLIVLDKTNQSISYKTLAELTSEIYKLLICLGTATNQFQDFANNLIERTTMQAGVIYDLTEVITGIAMGDIEELSVLSEKIHAMKLYFERQSVDNQVNIQDVAQRVKDTVKGLGAVYDSLDSFLHEFDNSR